jgi:FkbM family methyltransferase
METQSGRLCDHLNVAHAREGTFLLPANDTGISRDILTTGSWQPGDVEFFKRILQPGWTVVDIGANIGHHSVVYSKAVGPSGCVLSFEPQTRIFEVLCANLCINACWNVRPFHAAVGDHTGFTRMWAVDYDRQDNFGALGISKIPRHQNGELVAIYEMDHLLPAWGVGRVDFVKIDVQTYELFVLRGAVETLKQHRPILFVEISPTWMQRINEYDFREIYSSLSELDYQICDRDLRPAGIPTDYAEGQEWDIVAVPARRSSRTGASSAER